MLKCLSFIKNHSGLVLYGAGHMAHLTASYLDIKKIRYEYFCVTYADEKKKEYMKHPIKELSSVIGDLHSKGILICMQEDFAKEVIDVLEKNGLGENYYYDKVLFDVMDYELRLKNSGGKKT